MLVKFTHVRFCLFSFLHICWSSIQVSPSGTKAKWIDNVQIQYLQIQYQYLTEEIGHTHLHCPRVSGSKDTQSFSCLQSIDKSSLHWVPGEPAGACVATARHIILLLTARGTLLCWFLKDLWCNGPLLSCDLIQAHTDAQKVEEATP